MKINLQFFLPDKKDLLAALKVDRKRANSCKSKKKSKKDLLAIPILAYFFVNQARLQSTKPGRPLL
jgi:hypothetical protein